MISKVSNGLNSFRNVGLNVWVTHEVTLIKVGFKYTCVDTTFLDCCTVQKSPFHTQLILIVICSPVLNLQIELSKQIKVVYWQSSISIHVLEVTITTSLTFGIKNEEFMTCILHLLLFFYVVWYFCKNVFMSASGICVPWDPFEWTVTLYVFMLTGRYV